MNPTLYSNTLLSECLYSKICPLYSSHIFNYFKDVLVTLISYLISTFSTPFFGSVVYVLKGGDIYANCRFLLNVAFLVRNLLLLILAAFLEYEEYHLVYDTCER